MQETTKRLVNHIRTMVEQVQASTREAQVSVSMHANAILSVIIRSCHIS